MQENYNIPFLFDIPSTVKILSISRTAVYKLIRDGELQAVRVGRARRISRKQLDDYISRLEIAG